MIVTYQNGLSLEGIALFSTEDTLRIAFRNHDDVVDFHNIHGTWVSEDCEPVTVQLGARRTTEPPAEKDCICSADLAAHLVSLLYAGSEEEIEEPRPLKVMTAGACLRFA
jgi:hypothetical protein